MGISNQPLIIERLDILNKEMGCRLLAIALGLCAVGLTMVTVCAPYWSVTLPMTQNGQMVTVQSHRGLWKACYSGAAGTNMQCNTTTTTTTTTTITTTSTNTTTTTAITTTTT